MFTDKNGNEGDFGKAMISKRPPSSAANANAEATETITDQPTEDSPVIEDQVEDAAEAATEEATTEENNESSEDAESEKAEQQEDRAKGNEQIEPFSVDFGEVENTDTEESEEQRESASVSEEQVLEFLTTNNPQLKGITSLSDISQKVTLPEDVQEFLDFKTETNGRGMEDFFAMKKDWSKESDEAAIRQHLKLSEKGITDEDIDDYINLWKVPTGDEAADFTDSEIRERKLKWRAAHRKAMNFLDTMKDKYGTPLETQGQEQKPLTDEQVAELYRPYWNQRDKSLDGFNDYSITTSLGKINVKISEDDKKLLKEVMATQETFFSDWKTDTGINTDQAVIDMAFRIPKIRNRILKEIMSQTNALSLEKLSQSQRNVDLKGNNRKRNVKPSVGYEEIDSRSGSQKQTFGQPVVKKRN